MGFSALAEVWGLVKLFMTSCLKAVVSVYREGLVLLCTYKRSRVIFMAPGSGVFLGALDILAQRVFLDAEVQRRAARSLRKAQVCVPGRGFGE